MRTRMAMAKARWLGSPLGSRPAALVALPLAALALAAGSARSGSPEDLMRLLQSRSCAGCRLQDADLVHADLRDADLSGAALQRANLGEARLDGARLSGADLSFTSLRGASLRGADLRGARLEGTDLRRSDLSGARLDPGALSRSHWQRARGFDPSQLSHADLHNAGVEAWAEERTEDAEELFGEAIRRQPTAAISWVARGITRSRLGRNGEAADDFGYAARLYGGSGEKAHAQRLEEASRRLREPAPSSRGGNGLGGQLLSGAAGLLQFLAPLAAQAIVPVAF